MRIIGILLGITGMYIIVHEFGWMPMLGIFLFQWANNIDFKRTLEQ